MSNSPLVNYTKISQHKNSPRNHIIDTITIHCYVGQASVESMGNWFSNPSANASCNYGIGSDGRIALIVDESDRSWCSSNRDNDNRAVTIECASDMAEPYRINDKVYTSLINLCADICKRNGIKELKWKGDKSLIGHPDKQNMTVHRWYANKSCPGDYIYNRLGKIAKEVNVLIENTCASTKKLQATELKNLSEKEVVHRVGPLFTEDQKKTGILASVSIAQFILESGYGKTDLAQNANNCFGMKKKLSGNTWAGSTWDGKSIYKKITNEQDKHGNEYTVRAEFRKYQSIEDSIGDHSAYLVGAKNGSKLRYEGLKGCSNYERAIQIIKDGGYATDTKYVNKICSIIERFNLTQYDCKCDSTGTKPWYRVRKSWSDEKSQKGAFHDLSNAKKCADKNPGYSVYTEQGKAVYTTKSVDEFSPYKVRVNIDDLRIRKGPGTEYDWTGKYTGKGVFTIVEKRNSFGKLKSGAGWISLTFTTKI